jgi:hypothetical protein
MAKITLENGMVIEGTIEEFKQMSVKFPIEEAEVNDEYRKVAGRTPKAGDFIKFTDTADGDITIGKYYEIIRFDNDGDPEFYDNIKDINVAVSEFGEVYDIYERVAPCCEPTPESFKVGDYAKVVAHNNTNYFGGMMTPVGDIVKIVAVNDFGFRVQEIDGGNYRGNPNAVKEALVRATDGEITEAKAKAALENLEEKWAKIGRKHNEFRKGDIVRGERFDDITVKFIGEVEDEPIGEYIGVRGGDNRYHAVRIVEATLITPVEARVDR